MALPHLKNSQAGVNKWDPVHGSLFEVRFTVPEALREQFGKDEFLLTQHALKVGGALTGVNRGAATGHQKFMGTDRSYIQPKLDNTYAEITVEFTLNLRDDVDNYIYKLFRAWNALGYDVNTGSRALKREYCADWMDIAIANRAGDIFHEILYKDVMMDGGIGGWDDLDYDSADAVQISVKFISDWWEETMA